ncbi:hypothetical protein J0X15_18975 [Roseibium sp. CAU 1637]|uniref:Uncharacterized protein n=1 Tax=Roseibium limicola TaxID=2816037 RepID=A0A939EQX1_9HYPH|nr:hypothetical protein [Roseibium limicola]MBO0347320.1 hypothetical protein [Roseibium limicola]
MHTRTRSHLHAPSAPCALTAKSAANAHHRLWLLGAHTILLAGLLHAVLPVAAFGQAPRDFYIRSELSNGTFNGYHQISKRSKPGFVKVTYCDQAFWVRPSTVLWTETEASAGRNLIVERNRQDDREVLCQSPQLQVTIEDLDIKKAELDEMRSRNSPVNLRPNRMRVISEAFKGFK